jgi:hypothetical protein
MSADNWIYILHTKDTFKQEWDWSTNQFDNPIDAYRVVHTQAIDNYGWYVENELYNLWAYLYSEWWDCKVFYSLEEAQKEANKISNKIWYTEYWTSIIDATKYNFFNP